MQSIYVTVGTSYSPERGGSLVRPTPSNFLLALLTVEFREIVDTVDN
jgi:hypothetical protein